MKVLGTIAEYNPFHNGHKLHMDSMKKENPDILIGVLSGAFTSRGDLSIFDKFTKTKQALKAGFDLVIEYPMVYAMQRADLFAENAVQLLAQAHVQELWIGSEKNSIELYKEKYQCFSMEKQKDISLKEANPELLAMDSNDTLGFFYYKAIKDCNFPIELKTIERIGANYNDLTAKNGIASASGIRKDLSMLEQFTPEFVSKDKKEILEEEKLFPYIQYKILSSSLSELKSIFFVDEGIEHKLKDIKDFDSIDSFITHLSGKKYTKARMKRMLIYILIGVTKEEMNTIQGMELPFRVLGYSEQGKEYLNRIKKESKIYTNIKEGLHPALDIEIRISKILEMIYKKDLLAFEQKGPQRTK